MQTLYDQLVSTETFYFSILKFHLILWYADTQCRWSTFVFPSKRGSKKHIQRVASRYTPRTV